MSFANPTALAWLALAIPVVIFYILKIRLRRVPVSTVIFWRQIFDEKKPRSLWQRLRHLASLLVQLAFLGLLVAALVEPFFASEARHARRVILIVDNSASMNATDVEPNRLAKAKEDAHRIIKGLRARDEMAIIAAGTQPRVVCGLTGHQKSLRAALDDIGPTDGPTQLTGALELARRLVSESGDEEKETRIVVVTDACTPDAAKLSTEDRVHFVAVGSRTGNLAITRFQVRRSTVDPIGYETLVEIANLADEPTGDFRLTITLNDQSIEVIPLTLAANQTWNRVLENTTRDGGMLIAELVVKGDKGDQPYPDALVSDNKAIAVLPKRNDVPVHMHSPVGNLFLQKVLEANPLTQLTTSKAMPTEFKPGSVHVFHREVPKNLPPGPVLVVDPTNDCTLWKVGEKLQNPIVTQQDKDSTLMAHVRLDNVLMPEARKVAFSPAAGRPQVLAAAVTGDPLFALIDRPEGKVVVLTVNLDLGDLPFRTAFPILAMNVLGQFTSSHGELRESLAAGSTAEVALPPGEFTLKSPDGSVRKLPGGKTTIGPFDQCGVWSMAPDGAAAPIEEFAVNVMNKAESDLRPQEGVVSVEANAGLGGSFLGRPLWWYLIGSASVLLVLEWYLYQRRWIS